MTFNAIGPYNYTENDLYASPQYGDTVNSTFTQKNTYNEGTSDSIDTPQWMLNQGALKYWSQLNNKPHWQNYLQALNMIVNENLGDFTEEYVPISMILSQNITSSTDINTVLLPNDPTSTNTEYYIYYNGFDSSYSNFMNMNYLTNTSDANNRLGQIMQMQTMWTLSANQTMEWASNWNELWWFWSNYVAANNINSLPEYQNAHGLAYWQWANSTYSAMVNNDQKWGDQSWVQMGGLVSG